jgi:hypothetical protein
MAGPQVPGAHRDPVAQVAGGGPQAPRPTAGNDPMHGDDEAVRTCNPSPRGHAQYDSPRRPASRFLPTEPSTAVTPGALGPYPGLESR